MTSEGSKWANGVLARVQQDMFGLDEVVRLCLVALLSGGHVLLEANPGMGKTALVKSLAIALNMSSKRIQFTPDLMPADITGTKMPTDAPPHALEFKQGPIFASVILADEVNRASPKTQSAMLEAMAERQVTVLGEKHQLPKPFMVLATQNPIDQEGTFNLPEAQLDRFMFKIIVPLPGRDVLHRIMDKTREEDHQGPEPPAETPENVWSQFSALRAELMSNISDHFMLQRHISNIVLATNGAVAEVVEVDETSRNGLKSLGNLITFGLGPRAAEALYKGTRAYYYLWSEGSTEAGGVELARVAIPALRHRLKLDFEWESQYVSLSQWERNYMQPLPRDDPSVRRGRYERLLARLCVLTAPVGKYRDLVCGSVVNVLRDQGWLSGDDDGWKKELEPLKSGGHADGVFKKQR